MQITSCISGLRVGIAVKLRRQPIREFGKHTLTLLTRYKDC